MPKTIVVPVGEPEHMLRVNITDEDIVGMVMMSLRASRASVVGSNPDVAPQRLSGRYVAQGRDFHLATAVANLCVLTGRNLRDPDAGIPFGHVRDGEPRANTTEDERPRSQPIPGRPTLLSFLEDVEPNDDSAPISTWAMFDPELGLDGPVSRSGPASHSRPRLRDQAIHFADITQSWTTALVSLPPSSSSSTTTNAF